MRRAKHFGVPWEHVDKLSVFERDGWACKICGVETPREAKGTRRSDAPELDHIIPLAAGGPHTLANVQCACHACNLSKGAKIGWAPGGLVDRLP